MKKNLRKLSALLLALVMVLGMTGMAFAAGVDPDLGSYEGSKTEGFGVDTSGTDSLIPITKSVIIFNTNDSTEVREPDITFSYAIAKVDSTAADAAQLTATVNDGTNEVNVYNGVPAAITAPTDIVYANTNTVAATTKGFEDEKTTNITVDPSAFPHAGIYRYIITESTSVTPESVGMEARTGDYETIRYLDVYIYNPDTTHAAQWLAAAIIFKANSVDDSDLSATTGITTTTDKTTGFEPGTDPSGTPDYTDDTDVDRYFTYNLDITKAITGTLADKKHDFPFQIAITGALAHAVTVDIDNNGAASTASVSTTVLNQTAALADGKTYSVTGLPKGTTVTVTEYNDTVDTYKLTSSFAGTTSTTTKTDANEGTTLATAVGETNVLINSGDATNVKADTKTVITFTNNLAEISPTGVALRVAPYVAILCGGIVLLVLTKKRKADEEA